MMESLNLCYCNEQQRGKRWSLFSQQLLWVGFVIRSVSKLGFFIFFVCFRPLILHVLNLFSLLVLLFSVLLPCATFIKYHTNILSHYQHSEKEKNQKGCLEGFSLYFLLSQDSFIPKTFLTVNHYNLLHKSAAMFLHIKQEI